MIHVTDAAIAGSVRLKKQRKVGKKHRVGVGGVEVYHKKKYLVCFSSKFFARTYLRTVLGFLIATAVNK